MLRYFRGSVLTKILSETILFNQMSISLITISLFKHFHNFLADLVIIPGQGVDSYFCPYFLTGFEYLLYMMSYHVTFSINN